MDAITKLKLIEQILLAPEMEELEEVEASNIGWIVCPDCGTGIGYPVFGTNASGPYTCLECGTKLAILGMIIDTVRVD